MSPLWFNILALIGLVQLTTAYEPWFFAARAEQGTDADCAGRGDGYYCKDCQKVVRCPSKDVYPCLANTFCKDGTCQPINTCPATSEAPVLAKCPGVGRYPDPMKCDVFQQCSKQGEPAKQYGCPVGMRYDPVRGVCYRPTSGSPCYTFSPQGLCRGKDRQVVLHPQRQDVYVTCNGLYIMEVCPAPNMAYNTVTRECEFKCIAEGFFAVPGNTKKYYVCIKDGTKWLQIEGNCQDDDEFDESSGFCISGAGQATTTAPTTTEDPNLG